MDRNQLIIAATAALLTAFVLGWLVGAVQARRVRPAPTVSDEIADHTRPQTEAESTRHDALAHIEQREAELAATTEALQEARLEIEELRAYIDKQLRQV